MREMGTMEQTTLGVVVVEVMIVVVMEDLVLSLLELKRINDLHNV